MIFVYDIGYRYNIRHTSPISPKSISVANQYIIYMRFFSTKIYKKNFLYNGNIFVFFKPNKKCLEFFK